MICLHLEKVYRHVIISGVPAHHVLLQQFSERIFDLLRFVGYPRRLSMKYK